MKKFKLPDNNYPAMSRILSAIAIVAALLLVFAFAAPALADNEDLQLGQSFYCMGTDVEVHLQYLEIGDYPMGSTYTTTPLDRVEWVRLFYTYENHGDDTEEGYLQASFIDSENNTYKPDAGTYTGEDIQPHSTSSLEFIEVPVSKGAIIKTVRVTQGFDVQDFDVPLANISSPTPGPTAGQIPTPTPVIPITVTATANATASGSSSPGSCLPFLPFALIGGIGGLGMVVNRYGLKK